MKAELIIIGDEILNGSTLDTNYQQIASELEAINIRVIRRTTIADNREAIIKAVEDGSKRADILVTTGGLGPTKDDITKYTLCEITKDELVLDPEVLKHVEHFFLKKGRSILEINKSQALVPKKCKVLFNNLGTAPGMYMHYGDVILVSMPGVPYEMEHILKDRLIPLLKEKQTDVRIENRFVLTVGVGESLIADKIKDIENELPKNISLAYLPSIGLVKLRLTAVLPNNDNQAIAQLNYFEQSIRTRLGKIVFGKEKETLVGALGAVLIERGETLGTVESCTSGQIASMLTSVSGSSKYFMGSIIAYSYPLKEKLLGVSNETLTNYGAVSEEAIIEMAKGGLEQLQTNYILATSGIAGPGGGLPDKPVGTVWIALAHPDGEIARKFQFNGNRDRNTLQTSIVAIDMLRKFLLEQETKVKY